MPPQFALAKSNGWKYLSLFGYVSGRDHLSDRCKISFALIVWISPVTTSPKLVFPHRPFGRLTYAIHAPNVELVSHKDHESFSADHPIERD